jgi:hypothetical protein
LCVYVAEEDPATHRTEFRCVAQEGTRDAPIERARKWPSGVGVAGAAYATNAEIVVPNMTATGIASLYCTMARQDDPEKYKSIAAVPIASHGDHQPWGVAVATSDRVEHFQLNDGTGSHSVEGVRALASMAALAVALEKTTSPSAGDVPATNKGVDDAIEVVSKARL